jgi:uroporphyrinogen decarboxylase
MTNRPTEQHCITPALKIQTTARYARLARDLIEGRKNMDKRTVIKRVLEWEETPYVPWNVNFTIPAKEKFETHYGKGDADDIAGNHFVNVGNDIYFFHDIGNDCVQDIFGVVWDRSIDKDIGNVRGQVLPEPTLKGYSFPDPLAPYVFAEVKNKLAKYPDRYRIFGIGFSLFERAWTLRGMENLFLDFYEHPKFVEDLLNSIADYNIAQVNEILKYDIDAVHFGDDWGQQHRLLMGPKIWRKFIYPVLKRMYGVVKQAGKKVFIHSCGDVDELFDDLVGIGLNCFNPFQPEVMDVEGLMKQYRGRLSFYGGMSTQKVLPYGTVEDVKRETNRLLELGKKGGYIFSPAHDVPKDVPLENMLAFMEILHNQPGYVNS